MVPLDRVGTARIGSPDVTDGQAAPEIKQQGAV